MARYESKRFTAISNAPEAFTIDRLRNCELFYDLFLDHFRAKGFKVYPPTERLMVAIFDHPDNPRHPTPWYGATGPGHYFNAAFLFNDSMIVSAGDRLTMRYRVYVHDGIPNTDQLESAYQQYLSIATAIDESA